jgi:hypothetical protein
MKSDAWRIERLRSQLLDMRDKVQALKNGIGDLHSCLTPEELRELGVCACMKSA